MPGYPKWFSSNLVTAVIFVLFFTGCMLVPTAFDLRLQIDMPWRLSGDDRILVTALHVIFSFIALVFFGALGSIHVRQGLKKKRNLVSGFILIFSLIYLALSSVGLLYFGNETMAVFSSVSHILIGILILLFYPIHILFRKS